jgi:hypothetical protein
MPKYNFDQIEAALRLAVEYKGFIALKKITAKFDITNPAHFNDIAAMLKTDFGIDATKGVSVAATFHTPLERLPAEELDADAIFQKYNSDALNHARGKDRVAVPEGESIRDVKD